MMGLAAAARIVAGRFVGADATFTHVTTDSRAVRAGDLFVALKGDRFDGHDFVAAALAQGAVGAVVGEARAPSLPGNRVAVADPLSALAALAAEWRSRFALPLAVITGSNGKTTVKEMLAAILRTEFGADTVLATRGNLNNAIGVPLTLLELRAGHKVAVVEIGMNHRGETRDLAAIARPTIALVNNAQREHQEFMASVAEVAAEHADAILALPPDGVAIVNADDPWIDLWRAAARTVAARTIDFGFAERAAVRGRCVVRSDGSDVELFTPAGDTQFRLSVLGRAMVRNALAATAVALAVRASLAAVTAALVAFRPVAGRLARIASSAGADIIDDTYNANPDSVRMAIDVLARTRGQRWLVLGDMGEVGEQGPAFHREIGEYARAAGIDRVLTTGELAVMTAQSFGAGGEHFPGIDPLAAYVGRAAGPGVTVLVKGSRFMRMERVVATLTGAAVAEGAH